MNTTATISAVLFTAATLFADTLLEIAPGTVLKDNWNNSSHQTFRTTSTKNNVEAVREKGRTVALYKPGASTLYQVNHSETCGTDNLTFTVLIRAKGTEGDSYPIYAGAGSHLKPGLRLGIRAGKGTLSAYGLFVAASTKQNDKKFVSIQMNSKIRIEPNRWTVLTLSANRSGDLQLFVNGELAAGKSIRMFEKENIYPKPPLFATLVQKTNADVENPLQIEIAELSIRNELMSSSEIAREAENMLDEIEK